MNGAKKWHKAAGPAFIPGEKWYSSNCHAVYIVCRREWVQGAWEWQITYQDELGNRYEKDAWNFQVRYQHQADLML